MEAESFLFSFFYFRFFPWFPSPCGVRRVRDRQRHLCTARGYIVEFPSPCGVRRVRDISDRKVYDRYCELFPSPCGVRRVRDLVLGFHPYSETRVSVPLRGKEGAGHKFLATCSAEPYFKKFPSPCGVRRVRDTSSWQPARQSRTLRSFRPLAG